MTHTNPLAGKLTMLLSIATVLQGLHFLGLLPLKAAHPVAWVDLWCGVAIPFHQGKQLKEAYENQSSFLT